MVQEPNKELQRPSAHRAHGVLSLCLLLNQCMLGFSQRYSKACLATNQKQSLWGGNSQGLTRKETIYNVKKSAEVLVFFSGWYVL